MSTVTKKVLLSGAKPNNTMTLGNYIGALKNWATLQSSYDSLFIVVDLHAITAAFDPKRIHNTSLAAAAYYIASGIDPRKNIIAIQSHIPEHAELNWALTCMTYMGELSRMTQFKEKTAKEEGSREESKSIGAGLFCYPILMAADILLYQADLVPVGEDQKQHLELTRDIAIRVNHRFNSPVFKIPEVYVPPVGARIMNLLDPNAKMGKSDDNLNGVIYLSDSDDEIVKKLKRAVTDSETEIRYDEENKPGVSNLLTIQSALTGTPVDVVARSFAGKQYGHLKLETADIIVSKIGPIREEANRILNEKTELKKILSDGASKARLKARPTLDSVYGHLGFVRP